MDILIGADPELFVVKGRKLVSAHDLIPGTKAKPFAVEGGAIQVDGTAAEFNIDPAATKEDFTGRVTLVKKQLDARLKEIDPRYSLVSKPTRTYCKTTWDSIPESAKELGCDPDYNAYTGAENPRPDPAVEGFRSGGGHVHIGWGTGMDIGDPAHLMDCRMVVKVLDQTLFLMSSYWDKDNKRREIYGKPGAFRPKHYGVEYRVLSNAWTKSPELCDLVFDITKFSVGLLESGENHLIKRLEGLRYFEDFYIGRYLGGLSPKHFYTLRDRAKRHAMG